MSNCYKNIIKNFAHKLNEQQMPVQQPEEKVKLTQAEKAPIELDDGTILKHVEPLKGFEHIDIYVDEDDADAKYVVGDEYELEELAAQVWVKQVESGAFDSASMPWEFIIEQGDTLGILDSKTAGMVATALADANLDATAIKQTVEAIWGNSLKSLAQQIITYDGIEKTGFLSFDDPETHDVKDNDNIYAMRYEFEV